MLRKTFRIALLMLLLSVSCACAEEARELTSSAKYRSTGGSFSLSDLTDGNHLTCFEAKSLEITVTEPCCGLYLCHSGQEYRYCVEVPAADGGWETLLTDERGYANSYLALPELTRFRIRSVTGEKYRLSELRLLGVGETPSWVQDWQPFTGKADLLVLSAHADDELLFFGGVIPTYAGQLGKNVLVVYMTWQTPCRRNELLDGLWTCGVRSYPLLGPFRDCANTSKADTYEIWGRDKALSWLTGVIRQYRPEVIVTHDLNGEYGHGNHKACADAAVACFDLAAEEGRLPECGAPWQVKKLYLHLGKNDPVMMDWQQPLSAFDGKTAVQIARAAFRCHRSQTSNGNSVCLSTDPVNDYPCDRFGLERTCVGPDTEGNDLFEHIDPVK